jgi:type II secretory pathway component PulF
VGEGMEEGEFTGKLAKMLDFAARLLNQSLN